MGKRRPRQSYSHDFKRRVVAETFEPGISISKVARRHDINANLLFGWCKDPRFVPDAGDGSAFLPVTIDAPLPGAAANSPEGMPDISPPELGIWIEGGVRLVAKGSFGLVAV